MSISLDEYDKIIAAMPKRKKGDEAELSEEDEAALDKAWAKVAKDVSAKSESAIA